MTKKTPKMQMLTKSHFRRYMRQRWAEKDFRLEAGGRVGISIDELVSHSRKRNTKVKTPYLDLWIAILDEFISWEISLVTVFYALRRNRSKVRWTKFDRAILMTLMKIVSDSIAMRHLLLLGYDAAARALLRSIGEHMELFVATLDDPKLANEFVKSSTPEGAQLFWRSHIARGSLQKKMQQAWTKWFRDKEPAAAVWFANWGRQSNSKLSAFIHPSFAGGMFSATPFKTKHTKESWLGIWGDKSDGSVETIYMYTSYIFPMLLLHDKFPFEQFDAHLGSPIRFDRDNELHRHVKEGRFVLASLVLSLAKRSNRDIIFPEYDTSIFKSRRRKVRKA